VKYYLRRNSHRILKGLIGLLAFGAMLFGLWLYLDTRGTVVNIGEKDTADGSVEVAALEARVLNFGSVSWGEGPNSNKLSFDNLVDFNRTDYDVWIANLACHIETTAGCDKDLFRDFTKWFNVVGVGSIDNDTARAQATKDYLIGTNIQFFGNIESTEKSNSCGVIALPARFRLENGSYRQAAMPIVLCGIDGSQTMSVDLAESINVSARSLPVWVYALDDTSASQTVLESQYRSYIDAGADMVIGVSKPGLGEVERHGKGVIVYSLGRFMGPAKDKKPSNLSALLGITISASKTDELIEWTEIAKTCSGYSDLCLEAGVSKNLPRPDYNYAFSLKGVATTDPDNPIPASALQISDIAGYMKWVRIAEQTDTSEESAGF
jgi:hypothetical protein